MKWFGVLRALAGAAPTGPVEAPQVAAQAPEDQLATVLRIRLAVWEAWFGGDTATLLRHLGPELVAIGPEPHPWRTLAGSLADSARFAADGVELMKLEFPLTSTHHFGPVLVVFSEYRVLLARRDEVRALRGRSTEVFAESAGRWTQTSWHLDGVG